MQKKPLSVVFLFCLFCLAAASSFPAAPAAAQDAREHFQRGAKAYSQGDYDTAISEWSRAYEIDPKPRLQYNISQAHERQGRLDLAVTALEAYLKNAQPDDERMADARASLTALRERIRATSIRIVGGAEGATILVDGEDWGRTPRRDPLRVASGTHEVEVRKEGYASFRSTLVVPAGQQIELQVKMEAEQPGEGGDRVGVEPSPAGSGSEDSGGPSVLPWVLIGAGGAALLGGSILGVSALGKADDAVKANSSDDADSARGLALGSDILIGLGVASAGVGVVLLVLFSQEEQSQPTASNRALRVAPRIDTDNLGLQATFKF